VLSSVDGSVYHRRSVELAELAAEVPTAVGGAGASTSIATAIGAELLAGDPVTAAAELAARSFGAARNLLAAPEATSV
jgi:hypothetical protein